MTGLHRIGAKLPVVAVLAAALFLAFDSPKRLPGDGGHTAHAQQGQSVTVQDIFSVVYSHAGDQFYVLDERNPRRRTRVLMHESLARPAARAGWRKHD